MQQTYIQKSRLFLFPLVGIRNDRVFRPTNTYVSSKSLKTYEYPDGIRPRDHILILCYPREYSQGIVADAWSSFESEQIVANQKFLGIHETEDEFIYTMNMASWSSDWRHFLHGKYSLFSDKAKKMILNFRRAADGSSLLKPTEHRKLYCYLYPYEEKCVESFAEELGMPTLDLKEVRELCSKPDMAQEGFRCENLKESLNEGNEAQI